MKYNAYQEIYLLLLQWGPLGLIFMFIFFIESIIINIKLKIVYYVTKI